MLIENGIGLVWCNCLTSKNFDFFFFFCKFDIWVFRILVNFKVLIGLRIVIGLVWYNCLSYESSDFFFKICKIYDMDIWILVELLCQCMIRATCV